MRSKISINLIELRHNICKIHFKCTDNLKCYFDSKCEFYSAYSETIEDVPESIAVIPFICNILPIIWLTDSTLEIECIDKDFLDSIERFKDGYKKMYPGMEFKGRVSIKRIEKNLRNSQGEKKCGAFFSGGVDAFATLIAHIDDHPDLITVWGSDITLDDNKGWDRVWRHTLETGRQMNSDCISIKTNFRTFINNKALNILCEKGKDSWWHGFQHGIGLIGLSAPIAWVNGYDTIYIASSFTIKDKGKVTCASDPDIDGNVRFCGCKVVHDQYEYSRQEKVNHICEFAEKHNMKLDVRVCYAVEGGINCCACEKCIRTMMEIIANGSNPENYGFRIDKNLTKGYVRTVVSRVTNITLPLWRDIQDSINSNPELTLPEEFEWVRSINIMKKKKSIAFRVDLFVHRAIGKIRRTIRI